MQAVNPRRWALNLDDRARPRIGSAAFEGRKVSPLSADQLAELGKRAASLDRTPAHIDSFLDRRRLPPHHHHGSAEYIGNLHQARNILPPEALEGFLHLHAVSHC